VPVAIWLQASSGKRETLLILVAEMRPDPLASNTSNDVIVGHRVLPKIVRGRLSAAILKHFSMPYTRRKKGEVFGVSMGGRR